MKRKRASVARKPGEHWYQIVEYFDPDGIQTLPMKQGSSYIMGSIGDMVIVSVSRDTNQATVERLGEYLSEHGLEALIVSEGVTFLKLRLADHKEEKKLDAASRDLFLTKMRSMLDAAKTGEEKDGSQTESPAEPPVAKLPGDGGEGVPSDSGRT
jgi:hypothetical protein